MNIWREGIAERERETERESGERERGGVEEGKEREGVGRTRRSPYFRLLLVEWART